MRDFLSRDCVQKKKALITKLALGKEKRLL